MTAVALATAAEYEALADQDARYASYYAGEAKKRSGELGADMARKAKMFAMRAQALRLAAEAKARPVESFQSRVLPWLIECFGAEIAGDRIERNHRFIEEALELVQSTGCTQSEAHQLVDYVYGRPAGDPAQEVGGVMNTLAALCLAHGMDMDAAAEIELARVWTKVEKIRAKQKAKPKHSPLPEVLPAAPDRFRERVERLQHAIEGEIDGLAVDDATAAVILAYVDGDDDAPARALAEDA